jgi:hypothetical protein
MNSTNGLLLNFIGLGQIEHAMKQLLLMFPFVRICDGAEVASVR